MTYDDEIIANHLYRGADKPWSKEVAHGLMIAPGVVDDHSSTFQCRSTQLSDKLLTNTVGPLLV